MIGRLVSRWFKRPEVHRDERLRAFQRAKLALAIPCDRVHAPGAECGICNPLMVDGYSVSPMYGRERLAILDAEEGR